jgi:hypothetical protein
LNGRLQHQVGNGIEGIHAVWVNKAPYIAMCVIADARVETYACLFLREMLTKADPKVG